MLKLFFFTNSILFSVIGFTQLNKYIEQTNIASTFYESGEYFSAASQYSKILRDKYVDIPDVIVISNRYNAACNWTLCNQFDSAFYHLDILSIDYKDTLKISSDTELFPLHSDLRWNAFILKISNNISNSTNLFNYELISILDSVDYYDQFYRGQLDSIRTKFGSKSVQYNSLINSIKFQDSINIDIVCQILDENGWISSQVIGEKGEGTVFYVILHSNLRIQNKYLSIIENAVDKGDFKKSNYALLIDKMCVEKGENQIYGSQVGRNEETGEFFVFPIDNPVEVDKRRESVGLPPLKAYLLNWEIEWED